MSTRERIAKSLNASENYSNAYVAQHVYRGIAAQIRSLRKVRRLTQTALSNKIGNDAQEAISRWENLKERPTLATLLKLAAAFEVALVVKFVSFGDFVEHAASTAPTTEISRRTEDQSLQRLAQSTVTDINVSGLVEEGGNDTATKLGRCVEAQHTPIAVLTASERV